MSNGGKQPFTDQHAAQYLQRGFSALMARNFEEARNCARLVLQQRPNLAEAHFFVGLIALDTSEWALARKALMKVVELKKEHGAAWAQLAKVHVMAGNYEVAHDALANAVTYGSHDRMVQDVIGTVHTLMGDQEAAIEWFDMACSGPANPRFLLNRAQCLVFLGRMEDARTVLTQILAMQPQNAQAHWSLSRAVTATDLGHIHEMLGMLDKLPEGSPPKAYLYYGLGKEYEDLEMWPEAFSAYENGAKVRRTQVQYDEAAETETFRSLEKSFDQKWLAEADEGCDASSPIFIIGQPRTGTTLVERLITARDDVHSAGELQQFGLAVKSMGGATNARMISAQTAAAAAKIDMKALGTEYMESTIRFRSELPYFVDKLPSNYLYAPLIAAALPNAKIIHVTRGAMDSCFSSYKQFFAEAYFHSYDLGEMARHHVRYRKLMAHYQNVLGERMLEVAYEDVVADTEKQARRITDFVGLEWQDASLEFHKQTAAVTTASVAQIREKAHSRSVGRWKQFADELAPMRKILTSAGVENL